MRPIFITGTGTGIGKTVAAAIVTAALGGDYWKPIQAGVEEGTDAGTVAQLLASAAGRIHPELYKLRLPVSPHLAAAQEGLRIDLDDIAARLPQTTNPLVIEGAGGLYVPLNDREFVWNLVQKLGAHVILVSRNYLGSINHSLLTAELCKAKGLKVAGWIFNDDYLHYEEEIAGWSGYPIIAKLPRMPLINHETISLQAQQIKNKLVEMIEKNGV